MGKKKESGEKQIAKLALITAILTLITSAMTLLKEIAEWLTGK